ncbi:MAG: imelysin family protein [Flavobacterium sp.]
MKNYLVKSVALAMTAFTIASCSDNDEPMVDPVETATLKEAVTNTSNNIIINTYGNLNQKAAALHTAVTQLSTSLTVENLTKAKNAWMETRVYWEQSEGFLYGPVDTEGIDPAMDTWPVDVTAMNDILNSSSPITVATLENNNEARGFHLIEFLLWGENGTKTVDQLTPRQLELLKAAAQDLHNNTQKLHNGWIASAGNFVDNFINPSPNAYPSYTVVLEEITEGLIIIADEVANGKIEDPLNSEGSTPNAELEESRFSNNSKTDFIDNMRSIQNIYLGTANGVGNGKGLSTLVNAKDPVLDAKIKNAISDAIMGLDAIPGTFSNAIFTNRNQVKAAQIKVSALHTVLQGELKPFVVNNLK